MIQEEEFWCGMNIQILTIAMKVKNLEERGMILSKLRTSVSGKPQHLALKYWPKVCTKFASERHACWKLGAIRFKGWAYSYYDHTLNAIICARRCPVLNHHCPQQRYCIINITCLSISLCIRCMLLSVLNISPCWSSWSSLRTTWQ